MYPADFRASVFWFIALTTILSGAAFYCAHNQPRPMVNPWGAFAIAGGYTMCAETFLVGLTWLTGRMWLVQVAMITGFFAGNMLLPNF